MWVQLALILVSMVLSVALAPKPKAPKPSTIEDIEAPQVKEGTPQVVVFGDCWVKGWTVLGMGNFRSQPIKSGGKK